MFSRHFVTGFCLLVASCPEAPLSTPRASSLNNAYYQKYFWCYPCHCQLLPRVHPQTLLPPFHLDEANPSRIYQPSQQNITTNPTSSSSGLIAILQQFQYLWPLLPITGKIPDIITCSTSVCLSVRTNCLYFLTIAIVPSLSALLVPTFTKIDPPLPGPMIFSTLSAIASIIAPGKQTTMSHPLFSTLSVFLTIESPTNTLALFLTSSSTTSE